MAAPWQCLDVTHGSGACRAALAMVIFSDGDEGEVGWWACEERRDSRRGRDSFSHVHSLPSLKLEERTHAPFPMCSVSHSKSVTLFLPPSHRRMMLQVRRSEFTEGMNGMLRDRCFQGLLFLC